MADRIPFSEAELLAMRDQDSQTFFANWQQFKDQYRASRQQFLEDGGLPDAAPDNSVVLDELAKIKSPKEILDVLTRELDGCKLFYPVYEDIIGLMAAKAMITEAARNEALALGKTLIETKQKSAAVLDPAIEEALQTL